MEDSIGIIVKNHDGKILIIDGDYFIKTRVHNSEDAKEIIKNELIANFNIDIFKVKRIYKEKLLYMGENLTMYLVEVGIYNHEFYFAPFDKALDEVINFKAKEYFENVILKYEECSTLVLSIFNVIIAICLIDILPNLKLSISINDLRIGLVGLAFVYVIFITDIQDRLTNKIVNLRINTKIANLTTTIIMVIYCIRLVNNVLN